MVNTCWASSSTAMGSFPEISIIQYCNENVVDWKRILVCITGARSFLYQHWQNKTDKILAFYHDSYSASVGIKERTHLLYAY